MGTPINRAIEMLGGQAATARLLGVSQPAVRKWSLRSDALPASRVIPVARATGWQVTPHELRPVIYPHPDDGLPASLRAGSERVA